MAFFPVPKTRTVGVIVSTETTFTLIILKSAPVIHPDWILTTLAWISELYSSLYSYRMNLPCLQTSTPVATGVPMKTVTACEDTQGMTGTVDEAIKRTIKL